MKLKNIIIVLLLGLIVIFSLIIFILLKLGIPFFPIDYSIFSFLTTIITLILGFSVFLSYYTWYMDNKKKLIKEFLIELSELTKNITSLKSENLIYKEKIKIKENNFSLQENIYKLFDVDLNLKLLDSEQYNFFSNNEILVYYYELIFLIYLNQDYLIDEKVKNYVINKLLLIGNIDIYIYMFLYNNLTINHKNNNSIDKILEPYYYVKKLA